MPHKTPPRFLLRFLAAMIDHDSSKRPPVRGDWWLDDLPPLGGRLRFVFYACLLWLSVVNLKSPLAGTGFYGETDAKAFQAYGLLGWLGVDYLPVETLNVVVGVTTAAWIAAMIGLGGRAAMIVTAVGALFLQGMFLGSNALNHYYFLPVYTLAALCVARPSVDHWSIDWWVRHWRGRQQPTGGLGATGVARKLVLVAAVGFYFAAGFAKLFHSGLAWADGQTVQYFSQLRSGQYPLADYFVDYLWLAKIGSVVTLFLEVGAPLALFSRGFRHLWLLGLLGMHMAIRYGMGPAYWPNVVCLLLVVDWNWLKQTLLAWYSKTRRAGAPNEVAAHSKSTILAGRLLGSTALVIAFGTAVFGIFWWPLTNVYMYCSYFSIEQDIRAGHPRLDYFRAPEVQSIARQIHEAKPPREVAEYLCFQAAVRLTNNETEPLYLFDSVGTASWKQWVLTVAAPVIVEDLATKPVGRIEHDPSATKYAAQQFLEYYADVLRNQVPEEFLREYQSIEIVYPLECDPNEDDCLPTELMPYAVREEYAKREKNLPPHLRMVPLARVAIAD